MSEHTTQHERMTPLQVCVRVIGSIQAVADVVGCDRTAVSHWQNPTLSRAAGDLPSTRYKRLILCHCTIRNLPMKPEWLILGAPAAEVEAALRDHAARAA